MYPFSFEEFLWASGDEMLAAMINRAIPESPLPEAIHEQAVRQLRKFMALGGMPAVVARYCKDGNILECGTPEELFEHTREERTRQFLKHMTAR